MADPAALRAALDDILPLVERPSRYLGLERNLRRKPWGSVPLHVALAFPDVYEIGMCHLGSHILYHLVNRREDALAERCYAPLPDMAEQLRRRALPLYTLESYRPLAEFDVVGISLQSELNYVNLPYLLDLAGITRRAVARREGEPIVLGGGPCTANPEPVADFFDALLIGDAEAGLDPLLDAIRDARAERLPRLELLRRLAALPGVYVPRFYRWHPGGGGEPARWERTDDAAQLPVRRVWVAGLDPGEQPALPLLPFAEVVQDRLVLEVMRGCTNGCRFCQAGYWYRPLRELDPRAGLDHLLAAVAATGHEEVSLLSLSTADYSQVGPLVRELAARLAPAGVSVSLPSLRADAFSLGLADAVARVRKSGFTFAPETGSDRLRRVLNKGLTNADMVAAAEAAFTRGWNLIKVYAMVGLPTESDDDLVALVDLGRELAAVGRRLRGGRAEVKVSAAPFIPKPWTPFQWEPFVPTGELGRRLRLLKERFARVRGVRFTWSDPERSALEALLARGDRRLSATVERAHDAGALLDGWSDRLDLDAWRRAIADTGVDLERELAGRDPAATLPWEVVDAGVRRAFLAAERRRALAGEETPSCARGECFHCGIPGDGDDTRLAPASLGPASAAAPGPGPRPRATPAQPPTRRRTRFTFAKGGDARYLSHRQVMDALARAVRAARIPARSTEGFNPHLRLSMGPALALGHEGLAEPFDLDCWAPVRPHHLEAANRLLPEGLQLLDARELLAGAASLGKMAAAARYRIAPFAGREWPRSADDLPGPVGAAVRSWARGDDGSLRVELGLRPEEGPVVSLRDLLAALGVAEGERPLVRVTRELVVLRPPPAPTAATEDPR
jgi:radical SAM family uncharacterized protein